MKPVLLYIAQAFPHTRGIRWMSSLREAGFEPIVLYGYSGKAVWGTDDRLRSIADASLARKFDARAHRTARRLAARLAADQSRVRAVVVRDVFLSRAAEALAALLGVPWYLDLCDNYPEVVRQQARGRRLWMRLAAPVVDTIELRAALRATGVVFVTPESRDYVARKVAKRYGQGAGEAVRARALSVENAPIAEGPPEQAAPGRDLIYIGTFDDSIRDLGTVVRGLHRYRTTSGHRISVTLLTFDQARAEITLDRTGVDWKAYVRFEDPVPASKLPEKLRGYLAGLVPHSASPAVDYTISNKIFDYLYAGIAVLASDNPPNVRLLDEVGAGLCYRREDAEHFAKVLDELIRRRTSGDLPLRSDALYPRYTWSQQVRSFLERVTQDASQARDPVAT